MMNKSIGKNLVYQRKLKGYTQSKLSEESEVTIRTIQRIENNQVEPQLQTVKLLADALEIDVDELLMLENPKEETIQKKWLLFIHVSPLLGFIFPFSIIFPLFLWIHKRGDNHIYDVHATKVINFQITITLLYILSLISLVTVEGWGFLFFIIVTPLNFLVVIYNTFRAVTVQKCFYPLSFPLMRPYKKKQVKKVIPVLLILSILTIGCTAPEEKSQYDQLLDYEGKYEYINGTTLELKASPLDTILYAVIDKAKYPLTYIALDSFVDTQNSSVHFERGESHQVIGYKTDDQVFKLITTKIDKQNMVPRKELLHNPEAYVYQKPQETTDGLETGILEDEFLNAKPIVDMVKETIKGSFPDVHSVLIYKNNKLVLEEYFYGYDKDTPHQLRSATKPFIGGILGIAVDQGFIKSEQDKLLPYFSSKYQEIANLDDKKKDITIKDFLMYRHGLDCENDNPESKGSESAMMQSQDWVKHTLDLPTVRKSGEASSYCTGCPLTLGSLVEIATEKKIEDFAKENLFEPMGISNYKWAFEPNQSSTTTFSTMWLTPRDLVKLAKMYKDGGKWNGQQIISNSWVNKTFNKEDRNYSFLWKHKYFIIDGKQYNSYMATGNGGQKINIWPELDMITVFTGGNYNSYALYGKSTPPNEMIPNYILKGIAQK